MVQDTDLGTRCDRLTELTAAAGRWVEDNRELVRGDCEGLQQELRRSARLFRQCAAAARRKMGVGVFGPSQAGKSYLISALARDASGELLADFGGEHRDFLSEINPEGGKESTGLVTRFTLTRPSFLPEGCPVCLRLLTETDLVKILADTYYADCEHRETPDPKAAAALLDHLESRVGGPGPVTPDDFEDVREYLVRHFRAKPGVQELERSFWPRALAVGPRLGLEDRLRLYSLIWDEVEPFTDLLRRLAEALARLGNPSEAFVPLEALIPREGSIIDVAALRGLDGGEDADAVAAVTREGGRVPLPRAVIAALTAELTVVMREKPDPCFDHADLLDFPGYRSRYKFDDVRRELQKPGLLREMFLRGKVAYLFRRYCAERELTGMLLCIGPGNQEVQDLPGVINDWTLAAHGETPERRLGKPVSLYFVLTKVDVEFEQKKGAPSVESRWDNRLHASLLDFFGKQHEWPRIWDGKRCFNNLFLLRNPNFRFDAVLDYDAEGREKGIRPDQQAYVDALRTAFLNSKSAAAHFENPRVAWDAVMKLNDGGISYLRERLRPLCTPDVKQRQLEAAIRERQERLVVRFKPFWRSDDKEALRQAKTSAARQLARYLALLAEKQLFGELLSRLQVRDHDLYDLYFATRSRLHTAEEAETPSPLPVTVGTAVSADAILDDLFADEPTEAAPLPQQETPVPRPGDQAAVFAELIESYWLGRLHRLSDDPVMQRRYGLPAADFALFVGELSLGARRLELRGRIEQSLRRASGYSNIGTERLIWKQVSLAADILNAYIDWLDCNPHERTAEERTVPTGGRPRVLFQPPAPVRGYPCVSEEPDGADRRWYTDWIRALIKVIMDNVDFDGEQTVNMEQNRLLGKLLHEWSPEDEGSPHAGALCE